MRILTTLLGLALAASLTTAGAGLLFALIVLSPQPVEHVAYFAAFGLIGSGILWIATQMAGTPATAQAPGPAEYALRAEWPTGTLSND